ncbi:MAG: OmpA family protein [Nitrospirales bacterium]|nr:OmpA family protein [Nitrospirales bacterium]
MRRRREDHHDNLDRWAVSYADFITLLFAFFTALYAISQVDAGKLRMFTGSMRSAFRSAEQQPVAPIIEGIVPVSPEMASLERELQSSLAGLNLQDDLELRSDNRGMVLSIGDRLLFDTGTAVVKADAERIIASIAEVLQKIPNTIIVEGHTDNVPIKDSGSPYPSNWALSTARATEVLSRLIKHYNIPPERCSAAGYAEFRPKATNAGPEGRAKNRRVDIVIVSREERHSR